MAKSDEGGPTALRKVQRCEQPEKLGFTPPAYAPKEADASDLIEFERTQHILVWFPHRMFEFPTLSASLGERDGESANKQLAPQSNAQVQEEEDGR